MQFPFGACPAHTWFCVIPITLLNALRQESFGTTGRSTRRSKSGVMRWSLWRKPQPDDVDMPECSLVVCVDKQTLFIITLSFWTNCIGCDRCNRATSFCPLRWVQPSCTMILSTAITWAFCSSTLRQFVDPATIWINPGVYVYFRLWKLNETKCYWCWCNISMISTSQRNGLQSKSNSRRW